ncbi:PREDICTED: calcium-binding protein CML37 [Tarenaya hassleriana]|uniref:calcium-binding protein CML37 n=1 Tax=Tarenaya hassleriana TaxID=28532 RepID=UPI00053C885D|nr:PREDICTED: calcium-binding protein CML37 [Tarenaya hassleriana]
MSFPEKTQNSESISLSEKTQKSPLGRLYKKFSRKRSDPGKSQTQLDETRNSSCSSNGSSQISAEELRAVFDYMDANSDGRISAAELQTCVGLLGGAFSARDAEEAVKMVDLDGDGFMDFAEFLRLMEGEGENSYGEDERRRELKEAFGMYTPEGDEFITAASLRRTLSRLGESRTVDDCKAMIRAFDKNGDGVLSFDEFFLMMR